MSVIVVRDGVMASDSAGFRGDLLVPSVKILKGKTAIVGWAGDHATGKSFADWFLSGCDHGTSAKFQHPTKELSDLDFIALVLYRDSSWEVWTDEMISISMEMYHAPYMVVGSGQEAAMAALHMGAHAERAVEIACKTNAHCLMPVQRHDFDG